MKLDVGTAFFIYTRIVGIWDDTEQRKHHVGITLTHGAIAFCNEMQTITTLRTPFRRNDMSCRNGLGDIINDSDMLPATAALIFLNGLTHEQRNIFCLQIQIFQNIIIYGLYTVRPVGIAIVGFTLMQEDALDNTLLLGNLAQLNESGIRITMILGCEILHPVWLLLQVSLTGTLIEEVNASATHRHGDGSHLDAIRQVIYHFSAKVIHRTQACAWSCLWWNSRMPLSLLPSCFFIIHGIHRHESWINSCSVNVFNGSIALHVRLSEAEINLKIWVYCSRNFRQSHEQSS